ncbi:trehalose 6-phosphate phosphatase [Glutamicibacter uratoxydans]|uniref:Trehalose 6-phosphate phosphatase n=1 Tax=Glutamicibacter uratoxydans TaxID=43667 RepID=A0A4Y4DPY4_GLUUR|nr:trehalose-phosphatase [Glutamicibacter uratoxydans]GED05600.1 trehalose 6-phosphate phosphatase [Glutamicibacter uratoxydans]
MSNRLDGSVAALTPQLLHALQAFAAHPRILVALDFDGTLSPLVDHPQDARPLPESAQLVAQLGALPGVYTAVVSGRNLQSLAEVYPAPLPSIQIGSHGAERTLPDQLHTGWQSAALSDEQSALLAALTQGLARVAEKFDGVSLEYKPSATVLHVRRAAPEDQETALAQAQQELQDLDGVKLMLGKAVLEASVLHTDKGKALMWLREALDVQAVLFAGDDVTDENGFRVLQAEDISVKVGPGATAAVHRIDSPFDVPQLLQSLVSMRN